MGNKEKRAMINSFADSNFYFCPFVYHFGSCESSQKIEKNQKPFLGLVLDDYKSDCGNLIKKNGTTTMGIKTLRTLATEIFKAMNRVNHSYMKTIFTPKKRKKMTI